MPIRKGTLGKSRAKNGHVQYNPLNTSYARRSFVLRCHGRVLVCQEANSLPTAQETRRRQTTLVKVLIIVVRLYQLTLPTDSPHLSLQAERSHPPLL